MGSPNRLREHLESLATDELVSGSCLRHSHLLLLAFSQTLAFSLPVRLNLVNPQAPPVLISPFLFIILEP